MALSPPIHHSPFRFPNVDRLAKSSHVYLCTCADGGSRVVVKLLLGPYPSALHTELAGKGLMPKLLQEPVFYPGGYTKVEMEYLDQADGWSSLQSFDGPASSDQLQRAFDSALCGLQECLRGKAVHGDLREPNIFLRCEKGVWKTDR